MKTVLWFCLGILTGLAVWAGGFWLRTVPKEERLVEVAAADSRPLDRYSIENLGRRKYEPGKFEILGQTESGDGYEVRQFYYESDGKKVSGLMHVPTAKPETKYPVIVMLRGYADPTGYYPGYGTSWVARKLVMAGFITLAPDFLGYGGSASPAADVFEARFETYTSGLNLLADIGQLAPADTSRIGIWGHSNGGQIALTILEISQQEYPAVLWAPVSAGFPYPLLYYMDGNEPGDRELRKKLAEFETVYDAGQYNLRNYLKRIKAPILVQQGGEDGAVPMVWNRSLTAEITRLGGEAEYREYPEADHNLLPVWEKAVDDSIEFFSGKLGLTQP